MKFSFQGKSGDAKEKAAIRAGESGPEKQAKPTTINKELQSPPSKEAVGGNQTPAKTSSLRIPGKRIEQAKQEEVGKVEPYANLNPNKSGLVVPGSNAASSGPIIDAVAVHVPAAEQTGIDYPTQHKNVPADIVEDFNTSRKLLQNCLTENTPMIGHALRRIMVDMKLHPELGDLLLPEDLGNMVKALRESYGQTIAIKEKKRKKPKEKPAGDKITASKLFDMLVDLP